MANSEHAIVQRDDEVLVLNTNIGVDHQIDQMIEKNDGLWQCKVCGKTTHKSNVIRNHAETHIEGVSHSCHICNKTSTTRKALKVHIIDNHSDLSYTCSVCERSDMNKMAFKHHKRSCKVNIENK